jgi:signal transduction histidine kinase
MLILWFVIGVATVAIALGCVVLLRSPRHPAHGTFALGMAVVALESVLAVMAQSDVSAGSALDWQRWRLVAATLIPAPWMAFSRLYSRGDYLGTWRARRLGWAAVALIPFLGALLLRDGLLMLPSPTTGTRGPARLALVGVLVELFLLLSAVAILTQVERTFRESVGVMRWRIKYMVLGVAALFGYRLFETSQALLRSTTDEWIGRTGAAALLVACLLMSIALARGKVFNVDVYPSHALVYRSVAVLLAGVYLVIVGALSRAVAPLGNPGGIPVQAFVILLALAGLGSLLLSERIRQHLKRFVSRHLRRPVHDYRGVWRTFTARTSSLVEDGAYCRAVVNWVSETFQTLSSSIWLLEDSGECLRLGGSTLLVDASVREIGLAGEELRSALAALTLLRGPVELDSAAYPWAEALGRLHPGVFPDGGRRVGVPLETGGRLLGLMTLGDRVNGAPFTTEDFELLKCVGDQVAAGLLGLQLSGQLLRAKEMEAFQRMSTFFVHDLKNTASTLSLTLQNLQRHFGDPAFRDDALRAVQKSVQHLNGLIARLGRLRQELGIKPAAADLRATVEAACENAGPLAPVRLVKLLEPTPPVLLDPEQIQKVVVNLLLNAKDASGGDGEIRVRTGRDGDWGVIEVADTGVGMTAEFLRDSLFRPFQTTKHHGLGIGMFHSKMIVEAHRGRIEVDSTPGRGTVFRVLLPIAPTV